MPRVRLSFWNKAAEKFLNVRAVHALGKTVRELENIMERVLNFMDGRVIQPYHLPLHIQKGAGANRQEDNDFNLKQVVEKIEKQVIQRALERTKGIESRLQNF